MARHPLWVPEGPNCDIRGGFNMRRFAAVVSMVLMGGMIAGLPYVVSGQGTGETRYEHVGEHDTWGIGRFVDTFDDTPKQWLTFSYQGDGEDEIRFVCWNEDNYGFFAYADGKVLDGPTQTKIKIDGNSVIETAAPLGYNVIMGNDQDGMRIVLKQMRTGEEVRIRVTTVDGTHTFRLPLLGFKEASDWVFKECRVSFEEQKEEKTNQDESE